MQKFKQYVCLTSERYALFYSYGHVIPFIFKNYDNFYDVNHYHYDQCNLIICITQVIVFHIFQWNYCFSNELDNLTIFFLQCKATVFSGLAWELNLLVMFPSQQFVGLLLNRWVFCLPNISFVSNFMLAMPKVGSNIDLCPILNRSGEDY